MKKHVGIAAFLFSGLLFFSGCRKENTRTFSHLVTAVDITCQYQDVQIARHYTQQQKMEYVLLYLRLLEPAHRPCETAGENWEDVYEIRLSLGDGNQRLYRQRAHRYLAVDGRPWQTIDPEKAEGLYRLMRRLPSDSLPESGQTGL